MATRSTASSRRASAPVRRFAPVLPELAQHRTLDFVAQNLTPIDGGVGRPAYFIEVAPKH
jgi:hypothetical protein